MNIWNHLPRRGNRRRSNLTKEVYNCPLVEQQFALDPRLHVEWFYNQDNRNIVVWKSINRLPVKNFRSRCVSTVACPSRVDYVNLQLRKVKSNTSTASYLRWGWNVQRTRFFDLTKCVRKLFVSCTTLLLFRLIVSRFRHGFCFFRSSTYRWVEERIFFFFYSM